MTTLYKKSKNGQRIQQWSIETKENKYRTIEGLLAGVLTTGEWTTCSGKNIGKKNETSPEEQAQLESQSKINKKLDSGYSPNIDDCERAFEPTLAHVFEDHLDKITSPVFESPKLDGVRCIYRDGKLYSRKNKEFVNCNHIIEEIQRMGIGDYELDGEIYKHGMDFNSITSLVKKSKNLVDASALEFHIFDFVSNLVFSDRNDSLGLLIRNSNILKKVPHKELLDFKNNIKKIHDDYCIQGYEGVMLRWGNEPYIQGRTDKMLKVKIFQDAECKVLDITPGKGKNANTIGRWIVLQENGKVCKVSSTGKEEFNKEIFDNKQNYIGNAITVKFQGYTPDGIMRFPTFKGVRDYE
jgi:DNA ligase-1